MHVLIGNVKRYLKKESSIKIILKHALKYIPLFGIAMQFFGFVFIKRSLKSDKLVLDNAFKEINESNYPSILLMFPEGTLLSQNTRNIDQKHAIVMKKEYTLVHCLTPRSKRNEK